MQKRGLPGLSIFLVGLFVFIISAFLGDKFILFLLGSIIFMCYGLVKFYVLQDKAHERIQSDEHEFMIATHKLAHPSLQQNYCPNCTTILPYKARLCLYCGQQL